MNMRSKCSTVTFHPLRLMIPSLFFFRGCRVRKGLSALLHLMLPFLFGGRCFLSCSSAAAVLGMVKLTILIPPFKSPTNNLDSTSAIEPAISINKHAPQVCLLILMEEAVNFSFVRPLKERPQHTENGFWGTTLSVLCLFHDEPLPSKKQSYNLRFTAL